MTSFSLGTEFLRSSESIALHLIKHLNSWPLKETVVSDEVICMINVVLKA
jgi:hypothetical protein